MTKPKTHSVEFFIDKDSSSFYVSQCVLDIQEYHTINSSVFTSRKKNVFAGEIPFLLLVNENYVCIPTNPPISCSLLVLIARG